MGGSNTAENQTACSDGQVYDPTKNSWTGIAPMSVPRAEFAAATGLDGRIYAIGGISDFQHSTALSSVEAYAPSTNTWSAVASMSTPRAGAAAAVGPHGRVYAIGGDNIMEAYTPSTNSWTAMPSMSTARNFLAAAGWSGQVYALGGLSATGALNSVEAFNPKANSWASSAPMPTVRSRGAAAAGPKGSLLYVLGGDDGTRPCSKTVVSLS